MIDTVVFDFDGTLAKLNIDFNQMRIAVENLITGYGIDYQHLRHKFVLEMIHETNLILVNRTDRKVSAFTMEAMHIIENIEVEAAERGELFTSTKDLLLALKKRSIRTGIITRNCAKAVHTVFPDIKSYCSVVVCRDDVRHVKPHPEHLTCVLDRLCGISHRTIMIGDHPIDIETGRNAGSLTAGVLTGNFQEEDFILAGATIVLPEASAILSY